jgi:uncharacterized protein with HEPN domain
MKRSPRVFLSHILESIHLIESYTDEVTGDSFLRSVGIQDQVIRRLEVIGEAVKRLPADLKEKHPDIPWKKIHEYFGVDLKLTWEVVRRDLPPLKRTVQEMMHTLDDPSLFGSDKPG